GMARTEADRGDSCDAGRWWHLQPFCLCTSRYRLERVRARGWLASNQLARARGDAELDRLGVCARARQQHPNFDRVGHHEGTENGALSGVERFAFRHAFRWVAGY